MVYGIEKFKEYFKHHTGKYVFIGGTACDILLDELGTAFRATKDLDMVLIIEAVDTDFVDEFWNFITDGGYENKQSGSENQQFYRFSKPKVSGFPAMVELFSRKPDDLILRKENGLVPLYIEDSIASLSAILLNDSYYNLLRIGSRVVDGCSVLGLEFVILFKIKAWLDLKEKTQLQFKVDSKTVLKHKNDIFRLALNLVPSTRVELDQDIYDDLIRFYHEIENDKPDVKQLGIRYTTADDLINRIKGIYILS